ncbi:hypothetical protein DYJ25_04960 [Prevotella denticola]|nr:hypothetical protein DYJ25_04960 [Prevotella denticola]
MSVDNTICDRHQHVCREGRFIPVAMIYGKTLMDDLCRKYLSDSTDICREFGHHRCTMPEFSGYHKPLFYPYI